MGRVLVEAGAPVTHGGAVVGDQAAAAFGLLVSAHVGSAYMLGPITVTLAVGTPGLASNMAATVEAGPDQTLGHLGLRRRRAASSRLQVSHRSPQAMRRLQDRHRCSPRLPEPG